MKAKWLWLVLILAACGTPPAGGGYTYLLTPAASPDVVVAQATYQAAVAAATNQVAIPTLTAQAQYAAATGTAAVATSQAGATSDAIAIQMTSQAIALDGTRQAIAMMSTATFEAIAAQGTSQAVSGLATVESALAADEALRLAIQRDAEAAAVERARTWNAVWPWLAGVGMVTILAGVAMGGYVVIRREQPVIVNDDNHRPQLIIHGGEVRALPMPRSQPLALPAPAAPPDADLTPVALPALTSGHVLIAGETGSGKSTAMMAVLNRRQNVIVLDPHDAPGTWGKATVIGGGRNFQAIGAFITQTAGLLNERYQQRATGVTQFPPVTVATDEMPAIVSALGGGIGDVWREWLREGRKVNLSFIVSTQSTRVKTLGIQGEGDLLENFTYVLVLGKVAAAEYPDLTRGMERPAVIRMASGARPVIIPHEEVVAAAPEPVLAVEPPSRPYVAAVPEPLETQWGPVSPMEIVDILRRKRAGESLRSIGRNVYGPGGDGGAGFYKVQEVISRFSSVLLNA